MKMFSYVDFSNVIKLISNYWSRWGIIWGIVFTILAYFAVVILVNIFSYLIRDNNVDTTNDDSYLDIELYKVKKQLKKDRSINSLNNDVDLKIYREALELRIRKNKEENEAILKQTNMYYRIVIFFILDILTNIIGNFAYKSFFDYLSVIFYQIIIFFILCIDKTFLIDKISSLFGKSFDSICISIATSFSIFVNFLHSKYINKLNNNNKKRPNQH